MSDSLNPFHHVNERNHKRAEKEDTVNPSFIKSDHLSRGDRHAIQIDKKYYFAFRKLAFKYPGTNITQWADRTLAYSFNHGPIKKWLKKIND